MMDTREAITATPPQHAQPVVALVLQPMAQMAPPDMGGRAYNSDSQTLGPLTEAAVAAQGRLRTQATGQEAQQGMGAKVAAVAAVPIVVQAQAVPAVAMVRTTELPAHQPQTPVLHLEGAMAAWGVNTQAAAEAVVHLVEVTAATAVPER